MQSLLNTEQIERATTAIRRALSGLEPGTRLALDDVFAAFIEVRHVTEMRLATQPIACPLVNTGSALNRALTEYRAALTEWDRHLPRLHGWLLAERARLSSCRVHAGSVQSWVETDRQTREPRSTT
jgi:hypothetical protein